MPRKPKPPEPIVVNTYYHEIFRPLSEPHRYKAYYGGRGGGKSHAFAGHLVEMASETPLRVLCVREVQTSIKESVHQLLSKKIKDIGLQGFEVKNDAITGINGTEFLFKGLNDIRAAENVKSYEDIDICWVEEGQTISSRSWELLKNTIRKKGSEIWVSWNPRDPDDAVDEFFRGDYPPEGAIVRQVNFDKNPHFHDTELEAERRRDEAHDPERYPHIWLGDYEPETQGAYYAKLMAVAENEGRICTLPWDENAPVKTAWDIGISDDTSIWFFQQIGKHVHIIDFETKSGLGFPQWAKLLQSKPYVYEADDGKPHLMPHDFKVKEWGSGRSRQEQAKRLGVRHRIVPQVKRKEDAHNAVRAILPRCVFDRENCREGIRSLKKYRRDWNDRLNKFNDFPRHDEHSHPADAFATLALGVKEVYIEPEPRYTRTFDEMFNEHRGWLKKQNEQEYRI